MARDHLGLWHQICCPRRRRGSCLTLILSHFIVTALFFHLGSLHASIFRCHFHYNGCLHDGGSTSHAKQKPYSHNVSSRGLDEDPHHQGHHHRRRQGHHQGHQNLLSHAVRISRMEFAAHLNLGIPVEPSSAGNQNVLLLRLPPYPQNNNNTAESSSSFNNNNKNKQPGMIPLQSVDEALSFCHTVKLVLTRPSRGGVQRATAGAGAAGVTNSETELSGEACLAIAVGPHDSFHMNKWIRPIDNNNNNHNNNKHNLQPVGRLVWNPSPKNKNNASSSVDGSVVAGELFQQPPSIDKTMESFLLLESYLKIRNQVLNELQAILSQMTASSTTTTTSRGGGGFKNKTTSPPPTIIVMVANQGHADLFINYCCAARAVGMDFLRNTKNHHHLLLFAMDEATHKMAQQQQDQDLGITSFYNANLFSAIPMDAKGTTTSRSASYGHVMLAKIYAVELIVSLGYNVLFQDVDIVPYRADYVSYLQEKILQEETNNDDDSAASSFDLYFQYGHVPGSIFAPYSANSGFFYVQSNVRTRYFFSKLVASGMDLILDTNSHQATMTQLLLSEQASLFGLRIKILQGKPYRQQQRQQHQPNDDYNDVDDEAWLFPNGYYFHTKPEYMVRLFKKKIHPFLFHMNWSNNKTIKVKFLQQMGDWYIKDDCFVVSEQQYGDAAKDNGGNSGDCCVLKPVPKCHYRDMPSPNPCRESPAFQRPDAKSFW